MIIKSTQAARDLWKQLPQTAELCDEDEFFLYEIERSRVRIAHWEQGNFGNKITDGGGEWLEKKFWVNGKLGETFTIHSFEWPHY